ncbi:MAG: nicotinate (nicotinamide) nucleotide adenylyltransferase [Polaromonas sp.]|nr:nicotinate (nicotinamide) nucleotide adenylyltransferase [Polaromonas sp.]
MKIGVFGGAFDPPHNAHLALAQTALRELAMDALHVIPTGQAWHKARPLSPAEHRLAMTRLAFQDMPGVVVDDREIKRLGPTFTIDTLRALQAENPDAQLYLLMGGDQFAAFMQWHQWREITKIAIICIAARARFDWAEGQFDTQKQPEMRLLTLQMPPMAVSATQIRQLLASGLGENQAMTDLLPHPVASYISQHQLYKAF